MASKKRKNRRERTGALTREGEARRLLSDAEKALRNRPQDPRGWARLGLAQSQLGDHDAAIAALRRATELNPRVPSVWCQLAKVCARAGDLEQAAASYRHALEQFPGYHDATVGLAALPKARPTSAPARSRPKRTRVRRVRVLRAVTLLAGAAAIAFIVFCKLDSQAIPKTVDCVRAVIGDRAMLKLEEVVFGAKDWVEDRIDANRTQAATAEVRPVKVSPVVQATSKSTPSEFRPSDLTADADDNQAGRWLDRGTHWLTHVYPEGARRSVADLAYVKPGAALHVACGTREPADGPGVIAEPHWSRAFMAFSGGFQYKHFPGGIVCEGNLLRQLRSGVGTLIVRHDNVVRIGVWGRDWTSILPEMKDIRQFLLLVDGGQFNENVNFDAYALSRAVRVYRSALGLTRNGSLVYAAGNNLSAAGLAKALTDCGVVSAVHLDMNYGNATCGVIWHKGDETTIEPLTSRFPEASRFLGRNYRDFLYLTRAAAGRKP